MSTVSVYGENDSGNLEAAKVNYGHLKAQVFDFIHAQIHAGAAYCVGRDTGAIADAATSDILIVTGNINVHLNYSVSATGAFLLQPYEGTTTSALGTTLGVYNLKRKSANTADAVFYHTPTVSGIGLALPPDLSSGGHKSGGNIDSAAFDKFILKENTYYLLRLTNISGGSARAVFSATFYEKQV